LQPQEIVGRSELCVRHAGIRPFFGAHLSSLRIPPFSLNFSQLGAAAVLNKGRDQPLPSAFAYSPGGVRSLGVERTSSTLCPSLTQPVSKRRLAVLVSLAPCANGLVDRFCRCFALSAVYLAVFAG